jgi:hypothetical protein
MRVEVNGTFKTYRLGEKVSPSSRSINLYPALPLNPGGVGAFVDRTKHQIDIRIRRIS